MSALSDRLPTYFLRHLLVATLLLAISCKSNNPDPAVLTSFQGSWKITGLTVNPAFTYMGANITDIRGTLALLGETCLNDAVITFNANGSISNNVSSQASCRSASLSPQLINRFFGSTTTYTESGTQATLTTSGQPALIGTRTFTATTTTFVTSLPYDPLGNAVTTPYTYTIQLTKQ